MRKFITILCTLLLDILLLTNCAPEKGSETDEVYNKLDQHSYDLGAVGGFSEMINSGVKQLALSAPMNRDEMDAFIADAEKTASRHNV